MHLHTKIFLYKITSLLFIFPDSYVTAYTMFPVFLLVLDQDVTPETAMKYPELYKDLQKVSEIVWSLHEFNLTIW